MKHQQLNRVFDLLNAYKEQEIEILFNKKRNGSWESYSSSTFLNVVNELAVGFLSIGIRPGDKIALISSNRNEWNVVDFATQIVGAVLVPIYPTITIDDYAFIFKDSGSKIIFAETEELYLKAKQAIKGNKKVEEI